MGLPECPSALHVTQVVVHYGNHGYQTHAGPASRRLWSALVPPGPIRAAVVQLPRRRDSVPTLVISTVQLGLVVWHKQEFICFTFKVYSVPLHKATTGLPLRVTGRTINDASLTFEDISRKLFNVL